MRQIIAQITERVLCPDGSRIGLAEREKEERKKGKRSNTVSAIAPERMYTTLAPLPTARNLVPLRFAFVPCLPSSVYPLIIAGMCQ